jgi:hypothetical protein
MEHTGENRMDRSLYTMGSKPGKFENEISRWPALYHGRESDRGGGFRPGDVYPGIVWSA